MARQLRFHDQVLRERLSRVRTAFVSGPRQVGKTTTCHTLALKYLDWNNVADRQIILQGPDAVTRRLGLDRARERETTLFIDNLHGYRSGKTFLRRLSARHGTRLRLVVTTLDAVRVPRAGLPANSFSLRIHPWSVGECARTVPVDCAVRMPAAISEEDWSALLEHGGFPEPFKKRDARFTRRWQAARREQLLENDLPRLAAVRDPAIVQLLALLLAERSATSLVYSDLSRELGVTVGTVTRWVDRLIGLQYGFRVRPWYTHVPKALRKEPKWFLRDWSAVGEPQARRRTFIGCHLLKSVQGWTDLGFGRFELRYVRDKLKREVDFLVLRDRRPWFLVAVAGNGTAATAEKMAPAATAEEMAAAGVLGYFQRCTGAAHAFQVLWDEPFSGSDCFTASEPACVAARTFLSQLL